MENYDYVKKIFVIIMTNNMPRTMDKHQRYREKNWEKVRKRSKQHYQDKKKG